MARTRSKSKKKVEKPVEVKTEELKLEPKNEIKKVEVKPEPIEDIPKTIDALDIVIDYCSKQNCDFRFVAGVQNHQMIQKCKEYKLMLEKKN